MIKDKLKDKKVYLWYTILCMVVGIIAFGQLLILDKTLIWNNDGYMQWYPMFVKFQNSFHDLFSGKGFPLWDWSIGLGSDYLVNMAMIVFDPFCYPALLFSNAHADVAYFFVIVTKLYAVGFVVVHYLRYHKKRDAVCLIGAIGYVFCAWSLISVRHTFFITQMLIFPLLILGVDKVEDRRSPCTLILTVFWSVIQSLYFSYMSALFVAIYIIVRYFTSGEKKTILSFLKKIGLYILYAVIGAILMAAPVMVPALYALLQTSTGTAVELHFLPTFKQILKIVPSCVGRIDAFDNDSYIGMNVLFALMIPAVCMQLKRKKASAWMFIVTLVFFCIPALQSVTNGFSYASGRWCYVINFFYMYAAVDCLEWDKVWETGYIKKMMVAILVFLVCGLVAYLGFGAVNTISAMILMLNLVIGGIVCYVWHEQYIKSRWKFLTIIVSLNCALLGYINHSLQTGLKLDQQMDRGQSFNIYENNVMRAAQDIEEDDFYRIDSLDYPSNEGVDIPWAHIPANVSLYWDQPTIAEYLSTVDSNWLEWNRLLGNSNGYYRRMCSYSNCNRARMDFLLGVKYFMGTDSKSKSKAKYSDYAGYGFTKDMSSQGVDILKSSKDAGLGYVYESVLSDEAFAEYDYLEREQILMQSAVLQTEDMDSLQNTPKQESSTIQFEKSRQIPYSLEVDGGMKLSEKKQKILVQKPASLTIQLKEEVQNSELYVIFRNMRKIPFNTEELWNLRSEEEQNKVAEERLRLSRMSETYYGNFVITVARDGIKKSIVNAEGENQGISDLEDYMLNMGYVEYFDGNINCQFSEIGKYFYDSIEVVAVPVENFESQAENLEQNRLHITKKQNDAVEGVVDTKQGGLLYLSILYNGGWKVFVDGKEADKVYRVNTAFTGVEVPSGEHTIVLKYQSLGMPYTFVLFAIGLLSLGLLSILYIRRKGTHEKSIHRDRVV